MMQLQFARRVLGSLLSFAAPLVLSVSADIAKADRLSDGSYIINCSSWAFAHRQCQLPAGGRVELIDQQSRTNCAGNWGQANGSVWVDRGCRANFRIYPPGSTPRYDRRDYDRNHGGSGIGSGGSFRERDRYRDRGRGSGIGSGGSYRDRGHGSGFGSGFGGLRRSDGYTVTCSSWEFAHNSCRIPAGSRVELDTRHSRAGCEGNWGRDSSGSIWVDRGCRATFRVRP